MNKNEWTNYVKFSEMPDSGTFICQPTDDVLDADAWPIWAIIMVDGVVIHQENLYVCEYGGYAITDMTGWTKLQVVEWVQFDPHNNPQQQFNNILWLAAEDNDTWFCASVYRSFEKAFVMDIAAYYHVTCTFVGNGDIAEYVVVRGPDLALAESTFMGLNQLVWKQDKVCPLCKDKGEDICGHMYFYDARMAAF